MHINMEMKEFVINLLDDNLPEFYYYHNYEHTLYVADKAIEIGIQENCTGEELRLLNAAALWHDTGLIHIFIGHEEESCKLAKEYLPQFGFKVEEINKICGMIMATKIPQSPKNKLEKIIADADVEYLGTANASTWAEKLFKEQQAMNPLLTKEEWNETQISFLNHHYFTEYCKKEKEPLKEKYLDKLLNNNS